VNRRRQAWRKRAPLLSALVRLLVAVAVFVGPLQSGAHYFYCESLGLLASDPCASRGHHAEACPLPSIERIRIDCCERITLPTTPNGARADAPCVPPAPVVAILAAIDYRGTSANMDAGRRFQAERLRRPPRPPDQRRAELMVFLT
jgi:hypothetical protein